MKYLEYVKKYKYIIGVILIILAIASIFIVKILNKEEVEESNISLNEKTEEKEEIKDIIFIDIKGEVNNPGVYELSSNSKVNDAISKSGGLTSKADTSMINLSKSLTDEMVIIIYSVDEINEMKKGNTSVKIVEKECICPKLENNACIENSETNYNNNNNNNNNNSGNNNSNSNPTNGKISLNRASLTELATLTGVGEKKAQAIIDYRNKNNGFKSIKEIMEVSGIGEATYAKIKDRLTL